MSSPPELKAGHPPAVKAGGMRITQHKTTKPQHELKMTDEDVNNPLGLPTGSEKKLLVSGAPARGDLDFPSVAVQSFHTKPEPSKDFNVKNPKQMINIQQPKK